MNIDSMIRSTELVSNLCQSLFDHTIVKWFSYGRMTDQRDVEFTSSSAQTLRHYCESKHYINQLKHYHFDDCKTGLYLDLKRANSNDESGVIHDITNRFGIGDFLTIQNKHDHYCDFFAFALDADNENAENFYFNNSSFLMKFCDTVLSKLRSIVGEIDTPKITIPFIPAEINREGDKIGVNNRLSIITETLQKIHFSNRMDVKKLSKRELQCVSYLVQGFTAKEVAQRLNISYRTVEHHSASIKAKLGCGKKSALIELLALKT